MPRTISPIALAAVAVLCLSTAHASRSGAENAAPQPQAFTGVLKLQKTYHEVGSANGQAIAPAVFTAYGTPLVVNCAVAAGCYILVASEAQVGSAASEGSVALCLRVDGSAPDGCPYVGRTPSAGFISFSHRTGIAVPVGNHTVTTAVYSAVATTLHNFNTEVRLLK